MEVYVKDYKTFNTLGILNVVSGSNGKQFEINEDDERNDTSTFQVVDNENVRKNNFLVVNGLHKQYIFIIVGIEKTPEQKTVKLNVKNILHLFRRKVYEKSNIPDTIEEAIKLLIEENFVNTDDELSNLSYIKVKTKTETVDKLLPDSQEKLFYLDTYINNCRQKKSIYTDFEVKGNELHVKIQKKETKTPIKINSNLAETIDKIITEDTEKIAKVDVYIRSSSDKRSFYLKNDNTTTTDKNDPLRVTGTVEVISVEKEEETQQKAIDVFKSNRYNHLFEIDLPMKSKLVNVKKLEVGDPVEIYIENKVYSSIITKIQITDNKRIHLNTGNLKVLLTDKLKDKNKIERNNKLDLSGGDIQGELKINNSTVLTIANIRDHIDIPDNVDTEAIDNKINEKLDKTGGNIQGELTINNRKVLTENTIVTYGHSDRYDSSNSSATVTMDYYPKFNNNTEYTKLFVIEDGKVKAKKDLKCMVTVSVFINSGHGYLHLFLKKHNNSGEEVLATAFDDGGHFKQAVISRFPVSLKRGEHLFVTVDVPYTHGGQPFTIRPYPDNYLTIETI